ncbi:MAG: hypothetical protein H6772_01795 [Pseudomonadales bacterium]|nr:hypothetical protein [Pseudomonadales bacterium]
MNKLERERNSDDDKWDWILISGLMKTAIEQEWAPVELASKKITPELSKIKFKLELELKSKGFPGTIAFFINTQATKFDGSRSGAIIGTPIYYGASEKKIRTVSGLFFPKNMILDPKEINKINQIIKLSIDSLNSSQTKLQRSDKSLIIIQKYPILAVSVELHQSWKNGTPMIFVPPEILKYNQDQSTVTPHQRDVENMEDWRQLTPENEPGEFLTRQYFPALLEGLKLLLSKKYLPSEIQDKSNNNPFTILKDKNEKTVHLSFSVFGLLSTSHNRALKDIAFQSHASCSLVLSPLFNMGTEFGVEELIYLESLRELGLRDNSDSETDPEDQQHKMGVDFAGVNNYLSEPDHKPDQTCNCPLHKYHTIYQGTKALDINWGSSQLHHIVPRGLAYYALLVAYMKGYINENTPPRNMMLLLRGAKISTLVSRKNWGLFEDEEKIEKLFEVLPTLLQTIDLAVNSPYNLMPLCVSCHEEIHPDMRYVEEIAGFMHQINEGKITINQINDKTIEEIIKGRWKMFAPKEPNKMFVLLHQARQIIFGQGTLYHLVYKPSKKTEEPSLDLMDQMLSHARLVADKWFEEQTTLVSNYILDDDNWLFDKSKWKILNQIQNIGLHQTWILAVKISSANLNKLTTEEEKLIEELIANHDNFDLQCAKIFLDVIKILKIKQPFIKRVMKK